MLRHEKAWIRIRIRTLQKGLAPEPDPYSKYTDPQHWISVCMSTSRTLKKTSH